MSDGRSSVQTAAEIISTMRAAAPAGRPGPGDAELAELRGLTRTLIAARAGAPAEYARYLAIAQRGIAVPWPEAEAWLGGKTVLVTGGTGCIGSTLMTQIARCRPGRLVSVSRGTAAGWPRVTGAEYARADIRDRCDLAAIFDDVRPDVVFHLAAQRDPGLAEHEVHRTVTTNVLGTRNVISAAAEIGVPQVVCSSTGKALRPYSRDVYTATKRAAEWLLASAAGRGRTRYSAARFTHVVDNSIIHSRLLGWCRGGVLRLHGADIMFYAQSALDSAQLLLCAGLGARLGTLWVYALTDLGWPVSLLDLALGMLTRTGSDAPIYFSGHDPGYESRPFPGLYDSRTAGEVSPLMSAFEAVRAQQPLRQVADAFPVQLTHRPALDELLLELEETCDSTAEPAPLRAALDALSWSLLDAALGAVPREALVRAARLSAPFRDELSAEHRRVLMAIRQHAKAGASALA
jgi:nucleoside-diphosphate-sugar epimerase